MFRRPLLRTAVILLALIQLSPLAFASRASLHNGYLVVPRIDVDGYGALELTFRVVFNGEYQFVLEHAVTTSSAISNSGVFDPLQLTIDVDEVQTTNGELFALQLRLHSQTGQVIFTITDSEKLAAASAEPAPNTNPTPSAAAITRYTQQCSGCHGSAGGGTSTAPALKACANCASRATLLAYIRDTMPIGQPAACDSNCAALMADYILLAFNSTNQQVVNQTVGIIELLDNGYTLRKAAEQLLSRLPTLTEFQMVASGGSTGLSLAIDGMMREEGFYRRLSEIFNDYLLTDKYHSRNGSEAAISLLSSDDFPNRRWFDPGKDQRPADYETIKRHTNNGVAQEPLALINYVVRQNRPFTEILTADYMMVNPFSARTYGITGITFSNPNDPNEYRPTALPGIPHAGILTSPMFLNRYPTTATNRNRGRARAVFDLFLDTDILAIEGVRPGNSVDITTPVPTINNPECSKCHAVLDPVASIFQNWDHKGQYRPARLQKYGWYSDMEPRGFNGERMPLAGNIDSSERWLAGKIAADPKFPRAVTRMLVNGLTGKEPLDAPVNGTQAQLDAYVAERTLLNAVQAEFVRDNYNLKTLVRGILLSPYWRAQGLTAATGASAHQLTGSSYLVAPEQLDRKILSLLGFEWRGSLDSYYKDVTSDYTSKLNTTYHQIYGGINSDSVTTRLRTPNGMMGAMQLRMANELACYAVPHDFWLPASKRRLFLFVDHTMSPYDASGQLNASVMLRIRDNLQYLQYLQYLHKYLLGEELSLQSAELAATEQLFMAALNRGRQLIRDSGSEWSMVRLQSDCDRTRDLQGVELYQKSVADTRLMEDRQFVIRAWMAMVAYLLADYKFLYS